MRYNWSMTSTLNSFITNLAARGDHPAVIEVHEDKVETWSCIGIANQAQRLATGLLSSNLEPLEHVALWAPNSAHWVIARLGLGAAGALPVPIDDIASDREAAEFLKDAKCKRIFTTTDHVGALRAMSGGQNFDIIVLDQTKSLPKSVRPLHKLMVKTPKPLPDIAPDLPNVLIYTSGTTGTPKAFTLTHANIAVNVDAVVDQKIVGENDRCLLPLPLHHAYPYMGLLVGLSSGTAIVFPEGVLGPQIVDAIKRTNITMIVGVPRLFEALVDGIENQLAATSKIALGVFLSLQKLAIAVQRRFGWKPGNILFRPLRNRIAPELHALFSGGAKLRDDIAWKLESFGWRMFNGYGLAETASVFTANIPRHSQIGSDGKSLTLQGEMRIFKPDDDATGEIQLRGPSVFDSYRSPKEANAQAFTKDGWFKTGDLGRLDDQGFLHVTGRIKEMIVMGGGENIYPEPLEAIYAENPFVKEIAVFEQNGSLAAVVLPDIDAIRAKSNAAFEDTIRIALAETARELPSFQRLAGFALTNTALPRTRLAKLRRFQLPALYARTKAGDTPSAPAPLSEDDLALLRRGDAQAVWDMLQARFPDRQVSFDDNPELDLGLDSLAWVTLGLELQAQFGIVLLEDQLANIVTVRDLLILVADAQDHHPAETGTTDLTGEETKWFEPASPVIQTLTRLLYVMNRFILHTAFRLRVRGNENIPIKGPAILMVNHASDIDPSTLYAALPWASASQLRWSGDRTRVYGSKLRRWLARITRMFPVDERRPLTALKMAEKSLSNNDILVWFPESWRSPDGKIQRFQAGLGTLLSRVDVPVVPVWIDGSFEAWPRHRKLPRFKKITVHFGRPANRKLLVNKSKPSPDQITNNLHDLLDQTDPAKQNVNA